MLVLVILIWLVSPFAELAVIFILLGKNREYKKKIGDLEQLLYGRQRQQPGSSGVWANGQMPVRPPMGPGAPVNGPAPMQRPGMAASAVQINGQPPRRLFPIDAIGIWVLVGESMEEWLKIKAFKAWWGSSRWVVGPNFFCVWMPLIGWR